MARGFVHTASQLPPQTRSRSARWVLVAPSPLTETLRITFGMLYLAMAGFNALVTLRNPDLLSDIADLAALPAYEWAFRDMIHPNAIPLTLLLIAYEATVGILAFGKGMAVRLALIAAIVFQLVVSPAVGVYGFANLPLIALWAWLLRTTFDRTVPELIDRRTARTTLLVLGGFLGVTALIGGLGVLLDWWGLTEELLDGSPFDSYLIPGLTLMLVGGIAVVATVALARRHRLAVPLALLAGLMIAGFEVVQFTVIGLHPLQILYATVGILIVLFAARLWPRTGGGR